MSQQNQVHPALGRPEGPKQVFLSKIRGDRGFEFFVGGVVNDRVATQTRRFTSSKHTLEVASAARQQNHDLGAYYLLTDCLQR